jgi:hypothetical protein
VRQGEERGIDRRQLGVHEQLGPGQVRVMGADGIVVAVATGETDEIDVRMAGQQADELRADVAGRADDPDPDTPRSAVRLFAAGGAGQGPRRSVRRDRGGRLEPRAHGHTGRLTGGWLGLLAGVGWTVVMGA